ncbi:sugar phosphate isomerase/epimerase family protein [Haloarcula nitratireducens]|uniref:Sugar phosphate isomerase/epimerase n=1 Tax=Haloarcula nitratireducens TaxID=2487749 RepID=A0AAW4PB20_9EURY|nr:TIM barrel protein [Halomicroarcula nitratireducens]MBX0295080.1 sugar phosphate isomerase/epimerase [Halomicroarcula nitratireducens]
MHLLGKCPPDEAELAAAAERGFESVELHLRERDLEDVTATAETVERSPVDAAAVHTLHARPDEERPFRRSDELARRLDALLVVHSQYALHTHVDDLEAYDFAAPYAYENNPGASAFHLENLLLDRGHSLVLDTAHLYLSEADYESALRDLLEDHGDKIPLIHFNDATRIEDGLAFGDGEMALEQTAHLLDEHYDGPVVLEVMPDAQADARRAVAEWLS